MEKLKPNDYTRQYITNALIKLMQIKDYKDITISEITEKAGVGRVTYYRNFKSKEDIIVEYFNENANLFISNKAYSITKEDYYLTALNAFKEFKNHIDFFKLIVKAHLEYIYLDYLNKMLVLNFLENYKTKPVHFAYLYAGALFNISMQWLKSDCAEDAEDIAKLFYNFIFQDTRDFTL